MDSDLTLPPLPGRSPPPLPSLSFSSLTPSSGITPSSFTTHDPNEDLREKVRRTTSTRAPARTRSPTSGMRRRSFDTLGKKEVTRILNLKSTDSAAWQLVKYDLMESSELQFMISDWVIRRKPWFRKGIVKTFFTVEVSSGGRKWKPLALDIGVKEVLNLACPATKLESMVLRITVRQERANGGRMDLGMCTVRVLELLDPSQKGGAKGGGGGFWVGVYEGEDEGVPVGMVGRVELRAIVKGEDGGGYGVGILLRNAMSVKRDIKGVEAQVSRVGGGRQKLPLGEICEEGLWVDESLLWFGVGAGEAVRIRIDWMKKRFHCARMEVGVEEILGLKPGGVCDVTWKGGKDEPAVGRLVLVDRVRRGEGRVEIELTLTR